jgi:hypothetical protein
MSVEVFYLYYKCSDYGKDQSAYDAYRQYDPSQNFYQEPRQTQPQQQYDFAQQESDKDNGQGEQYENGNAHCPEKRQTHTHEFEASTKLAEEGDDRHNHRFAGVTGEAIPIGYGNHKHEIFTRTDFFGHFHFIKIETGPAIPVGCGKHVHLVRGFTSVNDGHYHEFIFATLIEEPLK